MPNYPEDYTCLGQKSLKFRCNETLNICLILIKEKCLKSFSRTPITKPTLNYFVRQAFTTLTLINLSLIKKIVQMLILT